MAKEEVKVVDVMKAKYVDILAMSTDEKRKANAGQVAAIQESRCEILIKQKEIALCQYDAAIRALYSVEDIDFEEILSVEEDKALAEREIKKLKELKSRLF